MSARFDNDRRYRLGSEPSASADDRASDGPSVSTVRRTDPGVRRVTLREDPCGRRSLTGLEFRRQRSS